MQEELKNIKEKNAANNANMLLNAAEIASKTDHPVAKGVGTAIKVADKLSGGKTTQKLGKAMNIANKLNPQGRKLQRATNFLSESGLGNRISGALQKKNTNSLQQKKLQQQKGLQQQKTSGNANSGSSKLNNGLFDSTNKKKTEEQYPDSGSYSNFNLSYKFIQTLLVGSIPVFLFVIFCCVFIASTQVFFNSIGLGMADALKDENAKDKLDKIKTDVEIENEEDIAYVNDIYINDTQLRDKKLNNYVQVSNITYFKRKYNEARLEKLKEFYPPITSLSKNYSKNDVYDFFNKMYDIYDLYRNPETYNVYLDLPLLMSTLKYQSSDMNEVFSSNLSDKDKTNYKASDREEFDYYYDWTATDYKLSKKNSEHDMEILAQNMVSRQVKEQCVNSSGKVVEQKILRDSEIGTKTLTCEADETYETEDLGYVVDEKKYKNFLKEFIEKKYYYSGKYKVESKNERIASDITSGSSSCSLERGFIKYELTQDQLEQIASLCYHEQETPEGAAAEASLLANLFEIKGSSYGNDAEGLYKYARNSGWFNSAADHMDDKAASTEIVDAVKSVLVDGKRILPGYIDEHDCIDCSNGGSGDITSVTNNGVVISKTDKKSYIAHTSIIKTVYGATYTFYSFPTDTSDPFGYTSEERRKEVGEFHYDYETGEPVGCSSSTSASSDMAEEMVRIGLAEYNEQQTNYFDGQARYGDAFGVRTQWCAQFVWYVSSKTEYNGKKLYPDIVTYKSASTGDYMNYFYKSEDSNINFYYNDSCRHHAGKNGSTNYTPKPGDYVFFAWKRPVAFDIKDVCGSCSSPQEHTGMVQKYENGKLYTIEGNAGSPSRIRLKTYNIDSCNIMGFGSWY